eukprot:1193021-Prymnesium_polylepis.2
MERAVCAGEPCPRLFAYSDKQNHPPWFLHLVPSGQQLHSPSTVRTLCAAAVVGAGDWFIRWTACSRSTDEVAGAARVRVLAFGRSA